MKLQRTAIWIILLRSKRSKANYCMGILWHLLKKWKFLKKQENDTNFKAFFGGRNRTGSKEEHVGGSAALGMSSFIIWVLGLCVLQIYYYTSLWKMVHKPFGMYQILHNKSIWGGGNTVKMHGKICQMRLGDNCSEWRQCLSMTLPSLTHCLLYTVINTNSSLLFAV